MVLNTAILIMNSLIKNHYYDENYDGYNNKDVIFCGKSNQRGTYSKLEPGTYYYVIRFKESATKENVFKGYLEVR